MRTQEDGRLLVFLAVAASTAISEARAPLLRSGTLLRGEHAYPIPAKKAEFTEALGPTGLRRYQRTAMPLRKETIPASQTASNRKHVLWVGSSLALRHRLADSPVRMGCDKVRWKEHQGLKSHRPRASSWHSPS